MGLFRFTLGVLGILLIIGVFSSFLPLLFLGGISTGNVAFAFGFPIFLIILGAFMVYYGFYYVKSKTSSHSQLVSNSNNQLMYIAKWGIIHTIGIVIGNFMISRLIIVDTLLVTLITASMVSIIAQVVRSHDSHFNGKWFVFYFLLYANIIWAMGEFILPQMFFQTSLFYSIVVGFTLGGIIAIIQKLNMNLHSVKWFSIALVIILLVANLNSLVASPVRILIAQVQPSNSSQSPENKQLCPKSTSSLPLVRTQGSFNPVAIQTLLTDVIDTSVWRIEGNIRSCYNGKYKGQYPDWVYCDDMIVSRWEKGSSGTIEYRWYTAVTAVWKPEEEKSSQYVFDNFYCEPGDGKPVTVNKESTSYYVHVSRDGTEIKIEY